MQQASPSGVELLCRLGFEHAELLASGMEGEVYRIGQQRVAKIWRLRTVQQLSQLQRFYNDLAACDLGFGTPQIEKVLVDASWLISVEREWQGLTLQQRLNLNDAHVPTDLIEVFVQILSMLKGASATPAMYDLPVLDEEQAFWSGASSFQEALLLLLERQVHRFGQHWRKEIVDFEGKFSALNRQLQSLSNTTDVALHGDLFGGNVLLTPEGQLSAVLDFGVFATAGDPRFDAAICGAVMNMYGPHASNIMKEGTDLLANALGYDLNVMRLYQASYALATSNHYSPDGQDGHFRWCIEQWRKPDILSIL